LRLPSMGGSAVTNHCKGSALKVPWSVNCSPAGPNLFEYQACGQNACWWAVRLMWDL